MNILVIDVGTSSMRGILLDHEGVEFTGKQIFYHVIYMEGGRAEQNPEDWKNALYHILKDVSEKAKAGKRSIDAIALTAQRSSILAMDFQMEPMGNAIMWQDKRSQEICSRLEKYNDRIFELSGSRANPVFSAGKMAWIRENREDIYRKTYKFMTVPDYLIYLLTGNICTDYSYGSRSHLMNVRTKKWDEELLEMFHVEKEKLCELTEVGSVSGHLTKGAAKITGCPESIPVITAGGDQQCGAIGQGVVREGILSVTAGTGGFLISAVERIPENLKPDVICNCSSVKGQYVLESNVLTCCSAFDWFRHEFYPDKASLEAINDEIEKSSAGANGCICLPYFQGRGTPDFNTKATGHFAFITLNTKRCDMLRSLLEGICYEIGNGIEAMRDYTDVDRIYINGGLTNSDAFNEMQAKVYDSRLIRKGKTDATVRGALMVAAAALGLYGSVEEAFDKIDGNKDAREYFPSGREVKLYQEYRKKMNLIYKRLYGA